MVSLKSCDKFIDAVEVWKRGQNLTSAAHPVIK